MVLSTELDKRLDNNISSNWRCSGDTMWGYSPLSEDFPDGHPLLLDGISWQGDHPLNPNYYLSHVYGEMSGIPYGSGGNPGQINSALWWQKKQYLYEMYVKLCGIYVKSS